LECGSHGAEFDIAQATLERKLRAAQVFPDAGGCYSTKQLTQAIFGSLFVERLRRITEEADHTALKNAISASLVLKDFGERSRSVTVTPLRIGW